MSRLFSPAFLAALLLIGWTLPASAQSAADLMRQGDALDARQQTTEALNLYLEAEKKGPVTAGLLHRIAKQYGLSMNDQPAEAGKKSAAETALSYAQRSVAADPADADAHVALAICYGRLVRFQETKVQLQYSRLIRDSATRALTLNAKSELACYVLGSWHAEMASIGTFKRGLARLIYGAIPPASQTEAQMYFKRALALNPVRMANYVDLGISYAAAGDPAAAREMIHKGLALPDRDRDDPAVRARGKQALADL